MSPPIHRSLWRQMRTLAENGMHVYMTYWLLLLLFVDDIYYTTTLLLLLLSSNYSFWFVDTGIAMNPLKIFKPFVSLREISNAASLYYCLCSSISLYNSEIFRSLAPIIFHFQFVYCAIYWIGILDDPYPKQVSISINNHRFMNLCATTLPFILIAYDMQRQIQSVPYIMCSYQLFTFSHVTKLFRLITFWCFGIYMPWYLATDDPVYTFFRTDGCRYKKLSGAAAIVALLIGSHYLGNWLHHAMC